MEHVLAEYNDNQAVGVKVSLDDESFIISLHDFQLESDASINYYPGYFTEYTWGGAVDKIMKEGFDIFDKRMSAIISLYIDSINDTLIHIGGTPLKGKYWTSDLYDQYHALVYDADTNTVSPYSKCNWNKLRPITIINSK